MSDQQLDSMVTDEHINKVSIFLKKWEDVANQLEVDVTDIQQTPGITPETKKHRLLTAWKNANYRLATYRKLVGVLDKLGEVRCANNICDLIRNSIL